MKNLFLVTLLAIGCFISAPAENAVSFGGDKRAETAAAVSPSIASDAAQIPAAAGCSDGWRITGYFTPIEADYDSAETREIEVKGIGAVSFNTEFLNTVFNEDEGWGEGWGKTRFGWYLGNYNGAWHKADAPLDARDAPLEPNSVAVDNSVIPNGSEVRIPALPGEYADKNFIANDVGVTVHGKHIDVYTGEGKAAERQMYRVTFEGDDLTEVCFKKP